MKYVDIHAHINFAAYEGDREGVVARARDAEVVVINVGTQTDTSRSAVDLADTYDGMYAAIGLHPIHTSSSYHDVAELGEGGKEFVSRGEKIDESYYTQLAEHPRVVAIGECGLDYYRSDEAKIDLQRRSFESMINIANKVNKPLMLHVRNGEGNTQAYKDALAILKSYARVSANFHFFAGTVADLKEIIDAGCSVSFTGVITFTHNYDEIVAYAPLDRIMSETDCPYVTPAPYRGQRNEPAYVVEVVRAIARIRGEDEEVVRSRIVDNARTFFRL